MNEQQDGPIPGIIGQDVPAENEAPQTGETKAPEKIFDSSEFTGVEEPAPETLRLNKDGQEKTQKKSGSGGSFITKWYVWAIACGVISVAAVVAILIIVAIDSGKIANANALAKYDAVSTEINSTYEKFEKAFEETSYSVYDIYNTPSDLSLYPTVEQYNAMKAKCLAKFGVSDDDSNFVTTRMTGSQLLDVGGNVAEAEERLSRINSSYTSATSSIENCKDEMLEPVLSDFEIEIGKVTQNDSKYFSLPIKVKYNGERDLNSLEIKVSLKDRNGVDVINYRDFLEASYSAYSNGGKKITKGDTVELDAFKNYYSSSSTRAEELESATIKLIGISGSYAANIK
jgi:hypothetical protein